MSPVNPNDQKVIVGRINGVYGVKGWVKVYSNTDPRKNITRYNPWYLRQNNVDDGNWRRIEVETGRPQGKTVVAKLAGIEDRDIAAELIGAEIAIEPEQFEKLGRDEFYWRDLIGCRVVNTKDEDLGRVQRLIETGANDVLVVTDEQADQEYLVPWSMHQIILEVDIEDRLIRVDWQSDWTADS